MLATFGPIAIAIVILEVIVGIIMLFYYLRYHRPVNSKQVVSPIEVTDHKTIYTIQPTHSQFSLEVKVNGGEESSGIAYYDTYDKAVEAMHKALNAITLNLT